MAEDGSFDEWIVFDDRAPDDADPGPARKVEITARCIECWGPVTGTKVGQDGPWTRIECQLCDRSLDGEDAETEAQSMRHELEANVASARAGSPPTYRPDASFVLKILPDMDRDKQQIAHRIAASLTKTRIGSWLSRKQIPEGAAGYLYLEARAFLSGAESLTHEMSTFAWSDVDFGTPRIVGVHATTAESSPKVSLKVPAHYRKPSDRELMARMGTALVAGMSTAFACEVGLKAILMTRLDEARRTHDLRELYDLLPADSRARLETDFPGIADALEGNRHTFGDWRYFEQDVGEAGFRALVDTDRVWELGKAARVIVDECVVAGLKCEVEIDSTFSFAVADSDVRSSQDVKLQIDAGEASIPWNDLLALGSETR